MAWDWGIALGIAGLVIGVPALIMAVPPFFQMLWGRPRLDISFDEHTNEDGKQLIVSIKNRHTENRFLRGIGVEREIGNVLGFFDIQEQRTNKFIKQHLSAYVSCPPTREMGLLVRALPLFHVGLHLVHARDDKCWIIDGRTVENSEFEELPRGDYLARVTVVCGEQVHNRARAFRVGKSQHETFWI